MIFYGKTDVGQRRAENQDNFIIKKYADDVLFAVVCDGMGGANGGSVASAVAVKAFEDVLDRRESEHSAFFGLDDYEMYDILSEAVTEANREVYRRSTSDAALEGMGTTLVACLISGEKAYVINVGDSRLYASENKRITQVTHDHSWVQHLVDIGKMTPDEAKRSNYKNRITRCVGIDKTVDPDIFSYSMRPGSSAVLCSDGLTNHVEPSEIRVVVNEIGSSVDIQGACQTLIDCANDRGGHDNITAVILSV